MEVSMRSFRIHWPAIIVAMLVSFLFSAGWFSYFRTPWMEGIGRNMDFFNQLPKWIVPMEFATSLACSIVIAVVLSIAIQASGPQTVKRGIVCGALLWLGFVATSWAQEYVFEVRPLGLYAINTGYQLISMMFIGAIVGGWKGKVRAA
jgi:hypothetical protein